MFGWFAFRNPGERERQHLPVVTHKVYAAALLIGSTCMIRRERIMECFISLIAPKSSLGGRGCGFSKSWAFFLWCMVAVVIS